MKSGSFGKFNSGINNSGGKQKVLVLFLCVLILALLLALVFVLKSGSVSSTEQSHSSTNVSSSDSATIVLYAPAKDLQVGVKLSDIELKEIYWPKNSTPEGAVLDLASLNNKYAKTKIAAGEAITSSMLSDQPEDPDVIKIKSGMRAVTIEISSKRSAEGWALPGSRVDVVLTHLDEGKLSSKVVVENARILSAGGDLSTAKERLLSGKRKIKASPTVTLELTPSDALRIETAQQLGTLSLHLRAPEDTQSGGINSVDQSSLSNNTKKGPDCHKGKIRVAGKEYWMGCDGKLIEIR